MNNGNLEKNKKECTITLVPKTNKKRQEIFRYESNKTYDLYVKNYKIH